MKFRRCVSYGQILITISPQSYLGISSKVNNLPWLHSVPIQTYCFGIMICTFNWTALHNMFGNYSKSISGWFYGERTRDGEKGWFPGNYSREIASKHVRARNLKQRHRLLQLSADLVQQQKKTKSWLWV